MKKLQDRETTEKEYKKVCNEKRAADDVKNHFIREKEKMQANEKEETQLVQD